MKRKQVFVRAINKDGKWDSVDVLDLDDISFRVFVIGVLFKNGLISGITDDAVPGDHIQLKE